VPVALSEAVARAMSRDPALRPASAAELSQSLRHWAQAPEPEAAARSASPAARSKRWLAVALLGCAGAAVLAWGLRPAARAVAPPAMASAVPATSAPAPATEAVVTATDSVATSAATVQQSTAEPTAVPAPKTTVAARPPRNKLAAAPAAVTIPAAPAAEPATGTVQIAVSPWGQVEVNGNAAGTTPPLTHLTLPEGTHTITVRNADFAPFTATVQVTGDKPAVVRHRFGS
jgi:serine/threonine-protein kinase